MELALEQPSLWLPGSVSLGTEAAPDQQPQQLLCHWTVNHLLHTTAQAW